MKIILPLAIVASLTLISCRDGRPTPLPGPPQGRVCNAGGVQSLIGRPLNAGNRAMARRVSRASVVRVLRPGQMVTMEFRADRLNLDVNARGIITGARCG